MAQQTTTVDGTEIETVMQCCPSCGASLEQMEISGLRTSLGSTLARHECGECGYYAESNVEVQA